VYAAASTGFPMGYPFQVSVQWTVTWNGIGNLGGTVPAQVGNANVRVAEIQGINSGG
jgi:hypothetical protein